MDKLSQEKLQEILLKHESELTEDDKAWLRARRFYLTKTQLSDYAAVLNPKAEVSAPAAPKQPVKQPVRQNVPQQPKAPVNPQAAVPPVLTPNEQPVKQNEQAVSDQPAGDQEQSEQSAEGQDAQECLDPDCTHENHQ